jgi:hypothetical protein
LKLFRLSNDLSQVICPSGKLAEFPSSPSGKNISLFQKAKSGVCIAPSRAHKEGRFAIVTNVVRDAMDVVVTRAVVRADERHPPHAAKPCGPDPPTLGSRSQR